MRQRIGRKTEGLDMSQSRDAARNGLSLGVLIIGSLYWDCDSKRKEWRRERLDLNHKRCVRVPIRYGRRSQSRGKSYTMVFSAGLEGAKFGTAIVIPCKSRDLVEEAKHLWAAERKRRVSNCISASWGCIGLLLKSDCCLPRELHNRWSELIADQPCYGQLASAQNEPVPVNEDGFLNIPWPRLVDGSTLMLDALLATATRPTLDNGRYPSAKKIAKAWKTCGDSKHICYFWNNRKNGIRTFQDEEILGHLPNFGHVC